MTFQEKGQKDTKSVDAFIVSQNKEEKDERKKEWRDGGVGEWRKRKTGKKEGERK